MDVLVCDHMLPGGRGTEFLAEVRLTYPEVIPIMLTGTADVQVAAEAIREARRLLRHAVPDPAPTRADRRVLPAGVLGAPDGDRQARRALSR